MCTKAIKRALACVLSLVYLGCGGEIDALFGGFYLI